MRQKTAVDFIKRLLGKDSLVGEEMISDRQIKYKVKSKIGEGGMGIVYKAVDPNERVVAVKVATAEQGVNRFRLETAILKLLGQHPNVSELLDWGLDKSELKFCVMEYIEGEQLDDIIKKKRKWFYDNILRSSVEIALELLAGLDHVHNKKIVHRDIKPHNIMVTDNTDGTRSVKLMDFGVAKTLEKSFLSFLHRSISFDERTLTMPGQPIGTLGYAPKEQIDNSSLSESADIFACGMTLLELIKGRYILLSSTISKYIRELDEFIYEPVEMPDEPNQYAVNRLNSILSKAIEQNPRSRYRRAGKMLKDLQQLKRDLDKKQTKSWSFSGFWGELAKNADKADK